MSALAIVLLVVVVLLFAMGTMSFIAMMKGCFFLRRLARTTPRYDSNILLKSPLVPAVSVVVPIPDVSPESREFAQRLAELHFGKHELVLVLDGPSEMELETWTKEFRLCLSARGATEDLPCKAIRGIYESRDPLRLVVVDKERGGLADALNAGINVAASPVIGFVEPDSHFEPTVLLSLIRPMLDDPGRTVAVCGVMPAPGTAQASWATRFGELEMVRMWLARCAGFAGWNRLVPVPGTSMLILRDAIIKMGGFPGGPLELFLHLHGNARASGKQYRVAFVPEMVSYLPAAESIEDLRQRTRFEEGEIAEAVRHRKLISGGLSAIGWALPGILCERGLRPLLETAAYVLVVFGLLTGSVDLAMAGLVLLSTVVMGILISMSGVVFRELAEFGASEPNHLARLFFSAVPENLGYRQVRNLWLIGGLLRKPPKRGHRA
ncbi:MAG TPA: glycosyltransferase family 2 protein [Bryobacteraceae bacterium]|nr:glycosyltransferase family 2 protein [Bryobacteraceae bacterium]